MMEVEEGRRKVPVGESRWDSTLAVVHWCKSVRTIVKWQMDVFFNRNWDAKWAWLLAGNGSITRSFSSGGQDHECWGGQGIGQVGGALHLEGCPVEVHVWMEVCEDDSSSVRLETMSTTLGEGLREWRNLGWSRLFKGRGFEKSPE